MAGVQTMAYAQARIQSRYGARADAGVWSRLHAVHELGGYLQTAQQTPLRPWVLGLSTSHSSHDIELALRQKYRHHVDEVAGWVPADWQRALQWLKRLADLPALQYLANGGDPLPWMRADPDLSACATGEPADCARVLRQAGCRAMAETWAQRGSILMGWLSQWDSLRPRSIRFERGLQVLEQQLRKQIQHQSEHRGEILADDHTILLDDLRRIFRRFAFQPAAVCAYLCVIALDIHHLRSDLLQRLLFRHGGDFAEGLAP